MFKRFLDTAAYAAKLNNEKAATLLVENDEFYAFFGMPGSVVTEVLETLEPHIMHEQSQVFSTLVLNRLVSVSLQDGEPDRLASIFERVIPRVYEDDRQNPEARNHAALLDFVRTSFGDDFERLNPNKLEALQICLRVIDGCSEKEPITSLYFPSRDKSGPKSRDPKGPAPGEE